MIRKFAATAALSAAIVASLAGGASAGSTWAVVHGSTYAVSAVTVQGSATTWVLTPVKKGAVPAGTKWNAPSPAEVQLGMTEVAGSNLMAPTSIKLK